MVRVKPAMLGRWRDLYRHEIVPAYKKAGIPSFAVWRTIPFGDTYEFTLLTPMRNFAQFDQDQPLIGALKTQARLRVDTELDQCIVGAESMALLGLPDISLSRDSTPPPLLIVQTVTISPKNVSAYLSFLKENMRPVVQKAGVEQWLVYRHVFGSSTNQITTFRSLKNYAELDAGPLVERILDPQRAMTLAAKNSQLVESSRIVIAQYDRELSYYKLH